MNLFEWQARIALRSAQTLAHFIDKTPPERLLWKPSACDESDTRSALDQVAECVNVNRNFTSVLSGCGPTHDDWDHDNPFGGDGKEAQKKLIESAEALATVVQNLDDGALTRNYETNFGPIPGAIIMEIAVANMQYHAGQVCFIQTLYGDGAFSIPPGFMEA